MFGIADLWNSRPLAYQLESWFMALSATLIHMVLVQAVLHHSKHTVTSLLVIESQCHQGTIAQ